MLENSCYAQTSSVSPKKESGFCKFFAGNSWDQRPFTLNHQPFNEEKT